MSVFNQSKSTRLIHVEDLHDLMTPRSWPCVSIYMPIYRPFNQVEQNAIRLRNLIRQSLSSFDDDQLELAPVKEVMRNLRKLEDDPQLWPGRREGLAVFASQGEIKHFHLLQAPPTMSVVAHSFHVKPLIRIVQDATRYQVLCLSRKYVALFEGNRTQLNRVDIQGLPTEIEQHLPGRPTVTQAPEEWHDEMTLRRIDEAVWQHHSRRSHLPLIMAALPRNQAAFRAISGNLNLVEQGVNVDPFGDLTLDELCERTGAVMQGFFERQRAHLIQLFEQARSRDHATDDVQRIARDASQGRVSTLMLEPERHLPGRVDWATGNIELGKLNEPEVDDIYDDLAELVLRREGRVLVLPHEQMPAHSGVCAIERW